MLKTSSPYARQIGYPLAAMILALMLAACSPGGLFSGNMMFAPHRTAERNADTLQSALMALGEGDQSGRIRLSESELASLLTLALVDEADPDSLVRDVQVWLEPDTVYLKFVLSEGVVQAIPGEVAINVQASLHTEEGRLILGLQRAGVGAIPILASMTDERTGAPHRNRGRTLVNRTSPLDVTVDAGEIVIDLP